MLRSIAETVPAGTRGAAMPFTEALLERPPIEAVALKGQWLHLRLKIAGNYFALRLEPRTQDLTIHYANERGEAEGDELVRQRSLDALLRRFAEVLREPPIAAVIPLSVMVAQVEACADGRSVQPRV